MRRYLGSPSVPKENPAFGGKLKAYKHTIMTLQVNRKQVLPKLTNSFVSFRICIYMNYVITLRSVNWFRKLLGLKD